MRRVADQARTGVRDGALMIRERCRAWLSILLAGGALLVLSTGLAAAAPDTAGVPVEPRTKPPYPESMGRLMGSLRLQDPGAILMGDSLIAAWPKDLSRTLFDAEAVNFGAGGDTTANLLWRVRTAFGPGMGLTSALLLVGTNDLPKRSPKDIAASIVQIVSEVQASAPKACITVITLLPRRDNGAPFSGKIQEVNERLRGIASPGVRVVDAHTPLLQRCPATGSCDLYKDTVHLTRAGYEFLTSVVRKAQNEAPCSR
ncbi:MAG TPA: GDSL-type esterase/lipase family protein [Azospirillum sp.]|nr:GDSL-type esterase/lipase family protein [Azospirillum sp.]